MSVGYWPLGPQHDDHWQAYLDFWCGQLDRKVRHYDAVERKKLESDDEWDRENGDLNA